MFWSIDNDDFRGNCHGKPYPIIEAAKEALISAYGLTDENLISPPSKPSKSKTRSRTQSSSKSSSDKEDNEKKRTSSTRRRNRVKSKSDETGSSNRAKIRRKESRTTEGPIYSSLELVTPSYTTPAPPSTPDTSGGFKCEDEGFYPHPKDCKKYFWCLSGAGDSGIVAHQFTCPAGLYFNKAADSCDYTRNVLCNKKLSKGTTTTTTTTEATTSKTSTTTKRVPPKITAATSRTTLFRTSTTEAYEDEYEYEDEDDFEDHKNAEEDPKVIKELLDLIKKAGGIEELEKQLKIQEDGSGSVSHPDATTPSAISKSLVQRVLGATKTNTGGRKNSYSFLNRNSRGPQNEGIKTVEKKGKQERGRLQYTTITRQRSQKPEEEEEDDDDEEIEAPTKSSKKQPEYVNIRRGRVSTTTDEPEENSRGQINRNKILGENDEDDTEIDDDDDEEPTNKKTATPQYVNIRRQRPSTTEDSTTSKYKVIRRGSTTEASTPEDSSSDNKRGSSTSKPEDTKSETKRRGTTTPGPIDSSTTEKTDTKTKYKILRRGSTTESSIDETASTLSSKRRGSTSPSVQDVSEKGKVRDISTTFSPNDKYKILKRGSTTEVPTTTEETSTVDSTNKSSSPPQLSSTTEKMEDVTTNSGTEQPVTILEQLLTSPESLTLKTTTSLSSAKPEPTKIGSKLTDNTGEGVYQTQPPHLLEPRPFSLSTNGPSSSLKPVTEPSSRVTKVSESNYKLRVRQKLPNTQTDVISTTILTTEKPTPFRTRPSRFKQTTSGQLDQQTSKPIVSPSNRARKRFSTTTEQYSDNYEEYDLNRTYRPSGIADLSSLTAVDFVSFKNRFSNNPSRPKRVRPTTEKTEASTSSRTPPLARKFLDGRRIAANKNEHVLEDQINSSSDTTHRIRPFTRAPSSFSSLTSTTEETTRPTLRNRKVIRRLRPTTSSKLRPQTLDNSNQIVFKKRLIRPSSATPTETENLIENASSNSLFNRRFTRPTTTEEANLSTTTEALKKVTTQSPKENDEQNETSEDVSVEEGENIKLSESNIRENSNVNNDNILNADDGKKIRRKILKRIRSKVDEEKVSTEPNIIIRTRKIIRKIKPTESTLSITTATESTEITTENRRRKIIRRLKPKTALSSSAELDTTEKTLFIRGRPFGTITENVSETEEPVDKLEIKGAKAVSEKIATSKIRPIFKYKPITHTTTSPEGEQNNSEEETEEQIKDTEKHSILIKPKTFSKTTTKSPDTDSFRAIDRSKYSTINRGTTAPEVEQDNSEEEREEQLKDITEERFILAKLKTFSKTTTKSPDTDPQRAIDRSKYSTTNRETTSPEDDQDNSEEEHEEQIKDTEEHSILTKPKTFSKTTTKSPDIDSHRAIDRSKYSTTNRGTTSPEDDQDDSDEEYEEQIKDTEEHSILTKPKTFSKTTTKSPDIDSHRAIDRSKYNTINRGTTSTTTKYETDLSSSLSTIDAEDEEEFKSYSGPRYKIHRPTSFQDEDDDEESEVDPTTKAPKYRILNPDLTNSREAVEDSKKIRILKPSLDKTETENDNRDINLDAIINSELNTTQNNDTEPILTDDKVNITNTEKEEKDGALVQPQDETSSEDENTEGKENLTEENDSNEDTTTEEIVTTTIRNYVNPILTRQKNRPAFRRPNLTTPNPLRTTSASKPRYRSFSRSTTSHPHRLHVTTDEVQNGKNQETERKFVPKNLSRTRYLSVSRENVTTEGTVVTTTQSNVDNKEAFNTTDFLTTTESNIETKEVFNSTTTEIYTASVSSFTDENNATESEFNNVTASSFTDENNTSESFEATTLLPNTDIYNVTVTSEGKSTTTESVNEITTTNKYSFEITNENVTIDSGVTLEGVTDLINETVEFSTSDKELITSEETILPTIEITTIGSTSEEVANETTINYIETSTIGSENTTTETTPVYHPKSSLRPIQNRPRYNVPKRLTSTESTFGAGRPLQRFNQRNRGQITTSRLLTPSLKSTTPSVPLKNRFIYKYSTTERNRFLKQEQDEKTEIESYDDEIPEEDEDVIDEEEEKVEVKEHRGNSYTPKNQPARSKPRISNKPDSPSFRKTTELPKVTEDLSDIDKEAVKNRNKNLFSKKRKMNTPFAGHSQNDSTSVEEKSTTVAAETTTATATPALTTTPLIAESVTKPSTQIFETTEYLTTLHHVFAEAEVTGDKGSSIETTTSPTKESSMNATNSIVERLIEVNRIVEVHDMNDTNAQKDNKVIDKVGVINRVTVVKIVDGNPNPEENEITQATSETPTSPKESGEFEIATVKEIRGDLYSILNPERQDRKFEIYGESKVIDYSSKDTEINDKKNAEIDGISNINIITPRPYYSTEASTISLEALFQTDTPQKLSNINVNLLKPSSGDDELLETDNSRFINVRVLGDKEIKDDDYITMKAHVVEVTPKTIKDVIKIVPIQVEMSRKLIVPRDFNMQIDRGIPKVNFQILKSDNK